MLIGNGEEMTGFGDLGARGVHRPDQHSGPCGTAWKACRGRAWPMPKGPAREAALVACNQQAKRCAQANPGLGDFGDLGWGWRSIGRGIKKVGKATYKVGALSTKAAMKVANATASSLCKKGGSTSGTSSAFCKAMAAKNYVAARQYLPDAVSYASKKAKLEKEVAAVQAARAGGDEGVSGFGAARHNPVKQAAYRQCIMRMMADGAVPYSDAKDMCSSELEGLNDSDVNLLAALDGANPDDLAFALAGVDPAEIGSFAGADLMYLAAPAAVAVVAGVWILLRG